MLGTGAAQAAEINVLASNAIRQAYLELAPQFEKATGHTVKTTWAGTNDVGETRDRLARSTTSSSCRRMLSENSSDKIVAGSKIDLVKSGVGVAVKARLAEARPQLRRRSRRSPSWRRSRSVTRSGPSGVYLQSMFAEDGHRRRDSRPRSKQTQPGSRSATIIAQRRSRARLPAGQRTASMRRASTTSAPCPPTSSTSASSRAAFMPPRKSRMQPRRCGEISD